MAKRRIKQRNQKIEYEYDKSAWILRKQLKMKCREKAHYATVEEALEELDKRMSQTIYSTLNIYPCPDHGHHLGHSERMSNTEILWREQHRTEYLENQLPCDSEEMPGQSPI